METQKKLFLLDAMALIYRAYFAFSKNPRISSKGQNTSAIFGFANTLIEILKNQKPTHIGVAFDTATPTARHIEFEAYKAHREAMPEDLSASIPFIMRLIQAFNIPILIREGYEADDIIGTLAKKAEQKGFQTFMMTPDKDFGQLVSDSIFMFKPARMGNEAEILGPKEICAKFEIENPLQVIDILGLWGDSSDNIPGIPGVGEKRAKELIAKYKSVENVIEHAHEIKGKLGENISQFAQQGLLSKKLATILLDVPIEFSEEELKLENPNMEMLKSLFEELEFRTLGQRFLESDYANSTKNTTTPASNTKQSQLFDAEDYSLAPAQASTFNTIRNCNPNYNLVLNAFERQLLLDKLKLQASFCFDTETTGLDAQQAELVGIAFSWEKNVAYYLYLPDSYDEIVEILKPFKEIFENKNVLKIGQNLKYDMAILRWYEIEVKGPFFDTMIAHYLLEPDMRHSMDFLAETYLHYKPISIEEIIGKKGKSQISMRNVMPDIVCEYSCEDADITLQLKEYFEPLLKKTDTFKLFTEIEMPLMAVLTDMENTGIKLDSDALKEFSVQLGSDLVELEKGIFIEAGHSFNIASPKQLGDVLFDELQISSKAAKTKTGQYATGEDILQKLVNKHPIIQFILDHRTFTKLKSTYVDSLPLLVNARTQRIHTSYNQFVAATGRLSSSNPNLQNIPVRTERGREIRKAFIPRNQNYILMAADYSQIELRLIAHYSQDKNMMQDFVAGLDIHTATAARVYGVKPEEVSTSMRRNAKSVNFGLIYGISAFGLSENLRISRSEAADIINQYFEQYSGIKRFMDSQIEFARQFGFVETIMKRRRNLPDINSSNAIVRKFAERNAINAPIQGSSADMIKIAMIKIFNAMKAAKLESKMILQVHDELVFDTKKSEEQVLRKLVRDEMQNAIQLSVPVIVDINVGSNWLDAH